MTSIQLSTAPAINDGVAAERHFGHELAVAVDFDVVLEDVFQLAGELVEVDAVVSGHGHAPTAEAVLEC